MPERWEREIRKLRDVEPREHVIRDRAARGPSQDGRAPRRNALVAGVVAGAVAIAGVALIGQLDGGGPDIGGAAHELPTLLVTFESNGFIVDQPDEQVQRVDTTIVYGDAREENFTSTISETAHVDWVGVDDLTRFVPGPTAGSPCSDPGRRRERSGPDRASQVSGRSSSASRRSTDSPSRARRLCAPLRGNVSRRDRAYAQVRPRRHAGRLAARHHRGKGGRRRYGRCVRRRAPYRWLPLHQLVHGGRCRRADGAPSSQLRARFGDRAASRIASVARDRCKRSTGRSLREVRGLRSRRFPAYRPPGRFRCGRRPRRAASPGGRRLMEGRRNRIRQRWDGRARALLLPDRDRDAKSRRRLLSNHRLRAVSPPTSSPSTSVVGRPRGMTQGRLLGSGTKRSGCAPTTGPS